MLVHSFLQCAGFGITALYFSYWRARQHRLNAQSWESLVAQLDRPVAGGPGKNAQWAMYRRSGVLLRIADHTHHNSTVDPALVAQLRRDALCLRVAALLALAGCRKSYTSARSGN